MVTPTEKGAIAEAVIAAEAIKAGVRVWRPVAEGGRADMAFEIAGCFVRIQCKAGSRRGNVIVVPTRTCRHTPHGYVRTTYSMTPQRSTRSRSTVRTPTGATCCPSQTSAGEEMF